MKIILLPKDYEYLAGTIDELKSESKVLTKKLGIACAQSSSVPFNIPEYQAIDDRLRAIQERVAEMGKLLSNPDVVPFEKIGNKKIGVYSLVTVENQDTMIQEKYYIIHSELAEKIKFDGDTLPVSPHSPVGQALLDKKSGNTVKIKLPKTTKTLKIIHFEKKSTKKK